MDPLELSIHQLKLDLREHTRKAEEHLSATLRDASLNISQLQEEKMDRQVHFLWLRELRRLTVLRNSRSWKRIAQVMLKQKEEDRESQLEKLNGLKQKLEDREKEIESFRINSAMWESPTL